MHCAQISQVYVQIYRYAR